MKSYREIADSVFARRDAYIIEQRRKKQVIARTTVSVGSVALVSLAGFALFKNDAFHDAPLISVSDTTTTVTNTPTKIGDTTTAGDATAPTTDGGIVTPTNPTTTDAAPSRPTATTPSKTEPVQTTVPSKTEPSKKNPTQPPKDDRPLIIGDAYDNYVGDLLDESSSYMSCFPINLSRYSDSLKNEMEKHKYEDVVYGVVVEVYPTQKISDAFWESSEELIKFDAEYHASYDAFVEEARKLYPEWDGRSMSVIKEWTDAMRAKYAEYTALRDERDDLDKQHRPAYYDRVLEQRFEALADFYGSEPLAVSFRVNQQKRMCFYSYYLELTAEQIYTLAEQEGYILTLALPLDKLLGTMEFEELW